MAIALILISLVEAGVIAALLPRLIGSSGVSGAKRVEIFEQELQSKKDLLEKLRELYESMVDIPTLRVKAKEQRSLEESLKAERGRITITQAELETVETRLRELEEIERELEASGLETKEEVNILQKKQADLAAKNEALKKQIAASMEQIDGIMAQIEMSTQMKEQVHAMKTELVQAEQKIDDILLRVEQGNDQYFILKRRYDALDIEYAQLYEKFSEAEAAVSQKDKE